jgi:hypothetical protein
MPKPAKTAPNGLKRPKTSQNGPKQAKTAQNGSKEVKRDQKDRLPEKLKKAPYEKKLKCL